MAIVFGWALKGSLKEALRYVSNPDKTTVPLQPQGSPGQGVNASGPGNTAGPETEERSIQLVSGILCTPENAYRVMRKTKQQFGKTDGIVAYHECQSFAKGEVTPKLAHLIGKMLAMELWGDRFEVLIATHVDKESHVHNHFIINSVSCRDGGKLRFLRADKPRMYEASTRICRECGLSTGKKQERRRINYGRWREEQNGGRTYAATIREDIDRAAAASLTEGQFFKLLREMGYEFKEHQRDDGWDRIIYLRPKGAERYYRFDYLGEGYSPDELLDRISRQRHTKDPFPEETRRLVRQYRKEHPPTCRADGLARLYYHYCYELHIIDQFPDCVRVRSHALREDLRRLSQLDEQTRFLGEHNIRTEEELRKYKESVEPEMEALQKERTKLRNRQAYLRRTGKEKEALELQNKIKRIGQALNVQRKEIRICDDVMSRAVRLQQEYDALIRMQEPQKDTDADRNRGVRRQEYER